MTGSDKYMWGMVLGIGGSCAFSGGLLLSFTLIGACLGVPMALVGFPLMVWGAVWTYQGYFQRQQEVISAGIREGIASAQTAGLNPISRVAVAASAIPAEVLPGTSGASDSLSVAPILIEEAAVQDTEGATLPAPSAQDTTEEAQGLPDDSGSSDAEGSAPSSRSELPS